MSHWNHRWDIEEFHRGIKQTTGIEKCYSTLAPSQKTHIFASFSAFIKLETNRLKNCISWYEMAEKIKFERDRDCYQYKDEVDQSKLAFVTQTEGVWYSSALNTCVFETLYYDKQEGVMYSNEIIEVFTRDLVAGYYRDKSGEGKPTLEEWKGIKEKYKK